MSDDARMAREAAHGERVQKRLVQDTQRIPVTNPNFEELPKDFVAECMAMIGLHVSRGHFEQAATTASECAERWKLRQMFDQPGHTEPDVLAWHVTQILDHRTANELERHCSGTVGSLLEIYPDELVNVPRVGPAMIERIARALVRIGALTQQDAEDRIKRWADAMLVSFTNGGAEGRRIKDMAERGLRPR